MNFALDYQIDIGDSTIASVALSKQLDRYRDQLKDVGALQGIVTLTFDGKAQPGADAPEPIIRLVALWLRKAPWVIGGDTETVALRNSEQCYAFTPAAESVEISFFNGTELEVEDYIIEPTVVRLDLLIPQLLSLGDRLVSLVKSLNPQALESDEDCQELAASLSEARNSWREYQLHNRR